MPRKFTTLPSRERLHELLDYDSETGVFRWRLSRGAAVAGRVAGSVHNTGYRYIAVDGVSHKAHRLAWLYVYGVPPKDLIDHIDRAPDNNAIANLREATHAENQQNKRVYKNNASGFKGISWYAPTQRWRVRIQHGGINRCLGYFPKIEDALAARKAAEAEFHSHRIKI